jgi:hypothetical protein
MYRNVFIVCLLILASRNDGTHFEYAGLGLETDLNSLKQRYPTSIVQDRSAWLSKADSHDEVHYIEKRSIDGKEGIRIIFERPEDQLDKKPASWLDGQYARHPKCKTILQKLTQLYKLPMKERHWSEERLNHRIRTWSSPTETMDLDCYNIDNQGEFLAVELTIRAK